MTDFSKTNIHCSSIGSIMSNGRWKKTPMQVFEYCSAKLVEYTEKFKLLDEKKQSQVNGKKIQGYIIKWTEKVEKWSLLKNEEMLSEGAKSHLKKVYAYAKYGKWSATMDKGTKETNKGILAEHDSINLICFLEDKNLQKNEERVSNEFLTGVPDIFMGENVSQAQYIIDVKTSWDIETFLNTLGRPLNIGYWWQIQGYMAITGAKVGEVSYCLVNTPESLLNHERYKLKERLDVVTEEDPIYRLEEMKLINNMTFNDIPEVERRIRFLVERDDAAIEKIYKKVQKSREYLSEIEQLHLQGTFLAKEQPKEEETEENGEDSEESL